ncbi:MAG: C40 family peptidase [Deltaproteobacteria bacterium]|nr:C40 family peptidase [Deltaproteobacteria bacterium]
MNRKAPSQEKSRVILTVTLLSGFAFLLSSCASFDNGEKKASYKHFRYIKRTQVAGFVVQTGAFSDVKKAMEMTVNLRRRGISATYFKDSDGLFKVRFGSFFSHERAEARAQSLVISGDINGFSVISPSELSLTKSKLLGKDYLREEIVKSAKSFLGVPYLWGGESAETGFDCSGLTMTIYQLNGINLPRRANEQYLTSKEIPLASAKKGDMLFFNTDKRRRLAVTHVGIYIGEGKFIHAPGKNQQIRYESLESSFYKNAFVGAGSVL